MNGSHVAVAGGTISSTAYLTTLLTGHFGLSPDQAVAAAALIVSVVGALCGVVAKKWPNLFNPAPPAA